MAEVEERLDEVEWLPPKKRQEYFEQRLREIIWYAYNNAPTIKRKYDQAGIDPGKIRTIKDLENVPIIKKEELHQLQRENPPFGGLVTVPLEKLDTVFVSPGPLFVPWRVAEDIMDAQVAYFYGAGMRKGDIALITFNLAYPIARGWEVCFIRLGAIAIPLGPGSTELQVECIHRMGVTAFIGSLIFLSRRVIPRAEEQGYDFRRDFRVRKVITGGEMLPVVEKERLEKYYGFSISEGYGTNEVGGISYTCRERSGMHLSSHLILEIVDPETRKQLGPGEVGEVVLTTLSPTYPLIRFGTGDLSYYTDEPCPCGRTSPRLIRILGRVGEGVKVKASLVYPDQVRRVITKFAMISAFQAEVSRPAGRDEITLKVEVSDESIDKDKLIQPLEEEFRNVCGVKLDKVEFVPKGIIPAEGKVLTDLRK